MSAEPTPLTARGPRVEVRPPTAADVPAYTAAVTRSSARLADFAVPDPHNLPAIIANQSATYRSFLVHALDPEGGHGLVGRANIANVVRGAFRSASIGYDSYDPYAGRGLFAEGLRLILDVAFADEPHGLGLHRIEANVQPANTQSAGLVRSLGFVHEGFSRDYLHLPGPDGRRAWRDHDRYTMLASDWPAEPYASHGSRRLAAVVHGLPDRSGGGLAAGLAAELGVPLFPASVVETTSALLDLLAASPVGGVIEVQVLRPELRRGLERAGFDPAVVPVIDLDSLPPGDVTRRDVARQALAVRAAFARSAG